MPQLIKLDLPEGASINGSGRFMSQRPNDAQRSGRAALIANCYSSILGRLVDQGGLHQWHQSHLTDAEIVEAFHFCEERAALLRYRNRVQEKLSTSVGKRVLLFGAYGNGNWGDAMQPSALAPAIEEASNATVFSYSYLNLDSYPFPEEATIPHNEEVPYGALNPHILSLFDGLIIGGGGLLAHPHEPLWDSNWPWLITTPYALVSCGAALPIDPNLRNLIMRATFVSGRDRSSVAAFSSFRSNSEFCPDPILATATKRGTPVTAGKLGTAYVLRGARSLNHESIALNMRPDDCIFALEPGTDWPLLSLFPSMRFIRAPADLGAALAPYRRVVTERYHGAIVGLSLGLPTFGLTRADHNKQKIVSLFDEVGAGQFVGDSLQIPWEVFPLDLVQSRLRLVSNAYQNAVAKAWAALLKTEPPQV